MTAGEAAVPLRRNREFVALWIGQALSSLGIFIASFAYPLVVLEATGSPAQAGLVGSVLAATTFLLRLPAGALVDRWNRKRILVACDVGRAVNSAAFALVLALGHFYLAHVLLVAFVEGALGVLYGPAESIAIRRVVPPEQLRDAIARNESRAALPGLLAPPLGGVLLAAGRSLPFVADALSYLASLGAVLLVRRSLEDDPQERTERRRLDEIFDGVRWIWAQPSLRALLLWFTGAGVVFRSIGLVTLVLARDRGASSVELGFVFAIPAAGGVAGALIAPAVLRRMQPHTIVTAFAWTAVSATLLLLAARSPYLIGVLGAAAFLLVPALNALADALVLEQAPDRLQGRAVSAAIQVASFAAPVAPVLAGTLLGTIGTTWAIVAYGGAYVALAVVAHASAPLRRLAHVARRA
jgi:MFS family permease